MNKIYKLKYDRRRNQVVAVSELTAGAGKESTGQVAALAGLTDMCSFRKLLGTLTPLAFLTGLVMSLLPGIALANPDLPTGGQIVAGQGNISTNGNQMTISQNTHGLVTNWNTFDVGQNHTVQFVQPDSSAVALNRVTGGHESQILGTLMANGQVMLVNPAGVMFGKGATVNTAGLVASTKNISNADFMAGHYTFSGGSDTGAEVVNQGSLTTTEGGFIVLAADRVKNSGNIRTPGGKTVLAAGDKVTLQLDNTGLASVSVSGSVVNALVENSGLLSATDGRVYLTARGKDMLLNTVVNNTGTVEASGLSGHGGEIVLNGGDSGVVSQSGTLLADSKTGHGGKITVEGQNIHMTANSRTSATGKTGGGEVYVGGGWQGKDSHIKNASQVVMSQGATIDVSATESGNGGRAVLWSDDYTNFRGDILAKGGSRSGHGGQVETSSHGNLQAFGDVDASAVAGQGGNWLLDPVGINITPDTASGENVTTSEKGDNNEEIFTSAINDSGKNVSKIKASTINNKLSTGTSVTIRTDSTGNPGRADDGDINIFENIKKTGDNNATLTLDADKDIIFNSNFGISATGGSLNVNLYAARNSDGAVKLGSYTKDNPNKTGATTINTSGGDVMISRAPDAPAGHKLSVSIMGGSKIEAKNIRLDATGGIKVDGGTVLNASEKLNINAESGDITFTARKYQENESGKDKTVNGPVMISGQESVTIQAKSGHLNMSAADKKQNGLTVSSDNGSVTLAGKIQDDSDGLSLTNINITSKGNTDIEGLTHYGKAAVLSGVDINAGGNVTIKGTAYRYDLSRPGSARNTEGVTLSGSHITSGGDVSLTGFSASKGKSSLQVIGKSNITANSGTISLNGTTEGNNNKPGGIGGVKVDDSTLSAASLNVKGVAKTQGTGFSLTNTTLENGLENLGNVTFSSAGSSAGVTNLLDSSIVNEANRDTLLAKNIENMTSIDMNGNAIFNDSSKGWIAGVTSSSTSNGVWTFDNTSVNAGGDVSLNGVGFTNSTIGVSGGDFRLMNAGPVKLDGDTITSNGGMDVQSQSGNISLTGSNVTAKNNINLKADNGSITLQGGKSDNTKVTSSDGEINVSAINYSGTAVSIKNSVLSALNTVNVDGNSKNKSGVYLSGSDITSLSDFIYINGSSRTDYYEQKPDAGVVIFGTNDNGNVTFNALKGTIIKAKNCLNEVTGINPSVGLAIHHASVSFTGGGRIEATSPYAAIITSFDSNISSTGGDLTVNASIDGTAETGPTGASGAPTSGAFVMDNWYNSVSLGFNAGEGSNIFINADTSKDKEHRLPGFSAVTPDSTGTQQASTNGYVFTGAGNISVTGKSWLSDGVNARSFDNRGMTGVLTINGESHSGTGVVLDKKLDVDVSNALITGTSANGTGVMVISNSGKADLDGNTVTGVSGTSDGVSIKGNNITLINGTLEGTSGSGNGVILTGGNNFTLAGASVTGKSDDGVGVNASGNLTVNDNASIKGGATGEGAAGVLVSGNLNSTGGSSIHGTALSGDGVRVAGNTLLSGVSLSGDTGAGTGVNIVGNLKTDEKTTVTGNATDKGVGVSLGASLDGGTISGTSTNGTGLQLADNVEVTDSVLSGSSTSGDGVAVTGKAVLDDKTVQQLHAVSESGTGLSLNEGAVVSVVQTGTQTPVTTPAILTGTSQSGSGVATSGNVSISGVTLSGKTATDGGAGVTLGGNLTVADAISGISANATGNGTALVVDDVKVSANDYISTGKNFVINASASGSGVTAIKTQGHNHLDDVTLNGKASNGGTAVELHGQVSGGQITGMSDTGNAVVVSGRVNVDRTDVKGHSDSGTGLQINGNATLSNASLNGTSQTGAGAVVSGAVTADNHSAVSGTATADGGTGIRVSGSITGGRVTGNSTTGDAVHMNGGTQISGAVIQGDSQDGTAIRTEGEVSVSGSQLSGHSANGTDLIVSGVLSHDADTSINAEVISGQENIQEVVSVTPPPATEEGGSHPDHNTNSSSDKPAGEIPSAPSVPVHDQEQNAAAVNSQRQGAVNAQIIHMNQPVQDGSYITGTPSVPVRGYQPVKRKVDISLCDGENCRSVSLDASKPAEDK